MREGRSSQIQEPMAADELTVIPATQSMLSMGHQQSPLLCFTRVEGVYPPKDPLQEVLQTGWSSLVSASMAEYVQEHHFRQATQHCGYARSHQESGSSSRQQNQKSSNQIKLKLQRSCRLYSFICSAHSDNSHQLTQQQPLSLACLDQEQWWMKKQTQKAGRDGQSFSMGNQHTMVLFPPSEKRSKQNPKHPLTSMDKN